MATERHITDFLIEHAKSSPDKLALVTSNRSMTWRELYEEVENFARLIAADLPVDKQAIVGLLMPNTWQHVVANLAVVHTGHMAMPIDVIFKPMEIKAVIEQVSPDLIITDDEGAARIDSPGMKIINVNSLKHQKHQNPATYLRLAPDIQVASLFFTSGTTGKPKVVPNTHRNHIWNIKACSEVWKWTGEDSQLVSARLSHMLGLVLGLSGTLYHGSTMYLQDRFSVEDTLDLLASGRVTMFSHGPLVYAKLLEDQDGAKYDLSKVRLFISGSGPLPPAIWQQFKAKFGAEILEVYGTTESGRIASNLLNERIPGSPGRPLPGVEAKVDKSGQVLVRSPGVFPGYWHNLDATSQAMDNDGFYRTGDLGEFVDGRLILKGRVQEKIRRQGYTISPRDIEWALYNDPRIKEALVMGIQRPAQASDELVYFLAGDVLPDQVREFCAANLPSVWRPDRIIMLDKLPRTRSGKPRLIALKEML